MPLRRSTLTRRLTVTVVLSSLTALLSASVAFLVYDAHASRAAFVTRITTEAGIVAQNSVAPVLFDDAEAAGQTLGGLRAEPAALAAAIFSLKGGPALAGYPDAGAAATLPSEGPTGLAFGPGAVVLTTPIVFEGAPVGRLVVRAGTAELGARQSRFALMALAIVPISFLLAVVASRSMQRAIASPILRLAEAARVVSVHGDFGVRVAAEDGGEIGTLVSTFNEMLERIERQSSDLEEARRELERRVEERTGELAVANRELEAFSYSVSHDLRAPLRAIDGFSKAILETQGGRLDEKGTHYLQRVRAATQRMAQLIDDLLGLSRVSRREMVRESIDVSQMAAGVAEELRLRHPERAVRVDVMPGLRAEADPQLLRIVIENLVGNAWKFTGRREDARIQVDAEQDGPVPVFRVRDNGAGFDMAYADKLFRAFQRLHTDTQFEGTGIGLATVHRIVARHGGRIWARSTPNEGAAFHFTLEREP
jgi:signal transduction histidine kinase